MDAGAALVTFIFICCAFIAYAIVTRRIQ